MGKRLISQVYVCVVATEKATALLNLMKSVTAYAMTAIRKNLHKARLSGFFKLCSPHSRQDTPVLNILFVTRQARDFKILRTRCPARSYFFSALLRKNILRSVRFLVGATKRNKTKAMLWSWRFVLPLGIEPKSRD